MTSATPSPQSLAHAIECLVAAYVDEGLRAAQLTIARSLATGALQPAVRKSSSTPKIKKRQSPTPAARRSATELAQLEEKLYELVCGSPGASMREFSEVLKVSVRDLNRPMAKLKSAGRIRSAGERTRTRYFPAVGQRSENQG